MTHEFKEIIALYQVAKQHEIPAVMATVVAIEGSSYRRPGVGMLLLKNGKTVGAVSGGCVEKEVWNQSQSVFEDHKAKMMTYNGVYRLGCEGVLYILIEPFLLDIKAIHLIHDCLTHRKSFTIKSYYSVNDENHTTMGSVLSFDDLDKISFSGIEPAQSIAAEKCFERSLAPCFRLVIIGTEHDAISLCSLASATGWEVVIVGSEKNTKELSDFPGAIRMINTAPDNLIIDNVDAQTAFVIMTHNFAKDLLYLQAIKDVYPLYIGLLGPSKRREKLLSAFIDYYPEVSELFLDVVKGPAGLNIGAETPQEIAISIIAEILSIMHEQKPIPLHEKKESIHAYAK